VKSKKKTKENNEKQGKATKAKVNQQTKKSNEKQRESRESK